MKLPFSDEFEYEVNGQTYYVEANGVREWDEDERLFTHLSKLIVSDEDGNILTDSSDVYNEIKESIVHSNETPNTLTEEVSFEEENY